MINVKKILFILFSFCIINAFGYARNLEYTNQELEIYIAQSEPTQISFPNNVAGGFKKKLSSLHIDKTGKDLIIFSQKALDPNGEALIVRLADGQSFSLRIKPASSENKRDHMVSIENSKNILSKQASSNEPLKYSSSFPNAPTNSVSGLMREMTLFSEFNKSKIKGYEINDFYKGDVVLNDGTMIAKIERLFIGANLWGYVLDVENKLDISQKINPATFRLDGTRAVMASRWELSAKPLNAEQTVANKHKTKLYIVTKAKK